MYFSLSISEELIAEMKMLAEKSGMSLTEYLCIQISSEAGVIVKELMENPELLKQTLWLLELPDSD